jgi:hypothetical protein
MGTTQGGTGFRGGDGDSRREGAATAGKQSREAVTATAEERVTAMLW